MKVAVGCWPLLYLFFWASLIEPELFSNLHFSPTYGRFTGGEYDFQTQHKIPHLYSVGNGSCFLSTTQSGFPCLYGAEHCESKAQIAVHIAAARPKAQSILTGRRPDILTNCGFTSV
jgi:hypothetical protein